MRVLVLGGTAFLGRWIVRDALARGHDVTLLHRGLCHAGLFPDVEVPHGDRNGDHAALRGRSWDAVVDTSASCAAHVDAATAALGAGLGHLTLVSSVAAYRDWPREPIPGEYAERGAPDEGTHGGAKVACELEAFRATRGEALLARAAAIVGPNEYFARIPWWLARMARGGRVLAPGPASAPLQLVDARDLAAFLLDAAEAGRHGPVNVGSPPGRFTWGELLEACRDVVDAGAELVWVDGAGVAELVADPLDRLPLWPLPAGMADGLNDVAVDRALSEGLRVRPLTETVRDTWTHLLDHGLPHYLPEVRHVGLDAMRESILLTVLG